MIQNLLMSRRLTPELMCEDIPEFMQYIEQLSELLAIDLSGYEVDHIAMRLNDAALAEAVHQSWLTRGKVISDSHVNGRPIIVLELAQPLVLGQWETGYLELPYPAEGKYYPVEGWEHTEFVIPSSAVSPEDYFAHLCQIFPELKDNIALHQVQVKLSSPQGENERLPNPTVALKWQHICIKFHPRSLKDVILSESH